MRTSPELPVVAADSVQPFLLLCTDVVPLRTETKTEGLTATYSANIISFYQSCDGSIMLVIVQTKHTLSQIKAKLKVVHNHLKHETLRLFLTSRC